METPSSSVDLLGSMVIIILTIVGFMSQFFNLPVEVVGYTTVILGIITVILYFYRVTNLPLTSRTPLADSMVVVGGITEVLFILGYILELDYLYTISPYLGLGLIIGAVFAKILLLDQVLDRLLRGLLESLANLGSWLVSTPINFVRSLSLIAGIAMFFVHYLGYYSVPLVDPIASFLLSLPFLLTIVIYPVNDTHVIIKLISGMMAGTVFVLILLLGGSLYYLLPITSVVIWSISLSTLKGMIEWFYEFTIRTVAVVQKITSQVLNLIQEYPLPALRISLVILALPAYILAPAGSFLNIQWSIILPSILLILAALPTLVRMSQYLLPRIYQAAVGFVEWFLRLIRNTELMTAIGGIGGFISLFFIQDESIYLQLTVASVSTVLLAFAGRSFLMRFYDTLLYGVSRILSGIMGLIRNILPRLNPGLVISTTAWLMLIIGLFYNAWIPSGPNWGRWALIIGSILVWNTAYEKRRKRFYGFFRKLLGGIINRFRRLFMWLFRNVVILVMWIIAIGFFILSFGLFFPGSVELVSSIFTNVIDNRLVSIIIGLSLTGIGILTLQQSVVRRKQLQMEGGK